jgi:hypothetical protein
MTTDPRKPPPIARKTPPPVRAGGAGSAGDDPLESIADESYSNPVGFGGPAVKSDNKYIQPVLIGIGAIFAIGIVVTIFALAKLPDIVKGGPSEMDKAADMLAEPSSKQQLAVGRWTDAARESATVGGVNLKVVSAAIATIHLTSDRGTATIHDPALAVTVRLENAGKTGSVDYASWSIGSASAPVELKDNLARSYRMIQKSGLKQYSVVGQLGKAAIEPGDKIEDVLIFSKPSMVESVKYYRLSLSGAAFGENENVGFEIPAGMIRVVEEAPEPQPKTAERKTGPSGRQNPAPDMADPAKVFDLNGPHRGGFPPGPSDEFAEDLDGSGTIIKRQDDRLNDPNSRPAVAPEKKPPPAPERNKTDPSMMNPAEKLFEKPPI